MLIQCTVSYRENVLLLQFNKEMTILGPHSALNPSNYALDVGGLLKVLPNDTFVQTENNKDIRFRLPYDFSNYLNPNNLISIGYVSRKELKYVESHDGYVYNICTDLPLGNEVPQFNIVDGYGILENNNSIIYKYTGENRIDEIYNLDFYATVDGALKRPYKISKLNDTELLFLFEDNAFDIKNNVYLGVYNNPKTTDIYGLPIKGDVGITIKTLPRPSLETVSLSTIENLPSENRAYLMLKFDEKIKEFHPEDFAIVYESNIYDLNYEGVFDPTETAFQVWADLRTFLTFPLNPITLFTKVPSADIKTINYDDVPINPVSNMSVYTFNANRLEWQVSYSDDLKSNEIYIYFNTDIDYGTLITNSNFNSTPSPWDGSEISIPIGGIIFEKSGASDLITLKFNPSFGAISIVSDPYNTRKFIAGNTTNSEPATIKSTGNKISIIFSPTESSNAYPMSIDTFSYIGTKFVMSQNNHFLCYGYEPNGLLLFKDFILVPPMNGLSDNPFNGGSLNSSYVLQVDNGHNYRVYGDSFNKTIINGFVRVDGLLSSGQEVTLLNLEILGTPYIKLANGNILLDTVTSAKIIYE